MDRYAQASFDPSFKEGDAKLDPLAPPTHEDFNWPLLEMLLGEKSEVPETGLQIQAKYLGEILRGLVHPHRGKHDTFALGVRCVGLSVALGIDGELPRKIVRTYKQRVRTARWRDRLKNEQAQG